ncbi:MAG: hypothetical protein EBU90_06465 [Proteobacteria bacterium]|nr:hypothetical protein [Pseudomonadota bacterium]NBP13561.1 hypothetical protein [bacterium]
MPVVGPKLGILIKEKMIKNISELSGRSPAEQPNPQYFINFCVALGNGIATGTKSIVFTTIDSGLANPLAGPGVGVGKGIQFNSEHMVKTAYERLRSEVINMFGKTNHAPYPPPKNNSGEYLVAILKAVADSIKEVYEADLILTSTHFPVVVGSGIAKEGNFSGIQSSLIKNSIISTTGAFRGSFWPKFIDIITESYIDTVHNHSTAKVVISGAGVSPSTGFGSGVAV